MIYWDRLLGATNVIRTASTEGELLVGLVFERAQREASRAKQTSRDTLDDISTSANLRVRGASTRAQALMREIAGQGPEKTLGRGFAIVRSQSGEPVTRASQAMGGVEIDIQFQDGRVAATIAKTSLRT